MHNSNSNKEFNSGTKRHINNNIEKSKRPRLEPPLDALEKSKKGDKRQTLLFNERKSCSDIIKRLIYYTTHLNVVHMDKNLKRISKLNDWVEFRNRFLANDTEANAKVYMENYFDLVAQNSFRFDDDLRLTLKIPIIESPETKCVKPPIIVERTIDSYDQAKSEAVTMQRINSLRLQGLWSANRLPKLVEPKRIKTHWDYLLDEMKWMATDFYAERKWKNVMSKQISRSIRRHFGKEFLYDNKLEKNTINLEKRMAGCIAKMIKDFWISIEKFINFKRAKVVEKNKQIVMDQQLGCIIEKSTKLSNSLVDNVPYEFSDSCVDESSESSDETDVDNNSEIDELNKESEMNIDDVINTLPPELQKFYSDNKDLNIEGDEKEKNDLPNDNIKQVSFLLKHKLRPYQQDGVEWILKLHNRKLNGILADEMGLGKTIQTIALLAHLASFKAIWGPHLVIVPTSVMLNWEIEFKKWCPALKILTYYGSHKERSAKRKGWTRSNAFHVCITSYNIAMQDATKFRRMQWHYLILDEAHHIKNYRSQRWQTLLGFKSRKRLLLTGTPLQNSLMELWSLMHFLMPSVFESHLDFKDWFDQPISELIESGKNTNIKQLTTLHKVLRPFILRRLKDDVEKQLPKKHEHIIRCRMSKRQRFLYDDFMSKSDTRQKIVSGSFLNVANVLMQLRKVCNHPDLFDPRPVSSPFFNQSLQYQVPTIFLNLTKKKVDVSLHNCDMTLTSIKFFKNKRNNDVELKNYLLKPNVKIDIKPPPSSPFLEKIALRRASNKRQRILRIVNANSNRIYKSNALYTSDLIKFVTIQPKTFCHVPSISDENIKKFSIYHDKVKSDYIKFTPSKYNSKYEQNVNDLTNLHKEIKKTSQPFDALCMLKSLIFPENRLIQYDSGKLQALDKLLRDLHNNSHRVLIFTQMTKVLDILEIFLCYHNYKYFRLDGSTKIEKRQALMERFNCDDKIFCFILSTRSGGLGINLIGADCVIFYDSDWNPTMDAQAQDRCHRIGQTRDVHIYRLVSEFTIEENILNKANQKKLLGDLAIENGSFTTEFFEKTNINDIFENVAKDEMKLYKISQDEINRCLFEAEDEEDVEAAKKLQSEVKADKVDFDDDFRDELIIEHSLENDEYKFTPVEQFSIDLIESSIPKPDETVQNDTLYEPMSKRAKNSAYHTTNEHPLTYVKTNKMQSFLKILCHHNYIKMFRPPTPDEKPKIVNNKNMLYHNYKIRDHVGQPPEKISQTKKQNVGKEITHVSNLSTNRCPKSLFCKNIILTSNKRSSNKTNKGMPGRIQMNKQNTFVIDRCQWTIQEDWVLNFVFSRIYNIFENGNWQIVKDFVQSVCDNNNRSIRQIQNRLDHIIKIQEEDGDISTHPPGTKKNNKAKIFLNPKKAGANYICDNFVTLHKLYAARFTNAVRFSTGRCKRLSVSQDGNKQLNSVMLPDSAEYISPGDMKAFMAKMKLEEHKNYIKNKSNNASTMSVKGKSVHIVNHNINVMRGNRPTIKQIIPNSNVISNSFTISNNQKKYRQCSTISTLKNSKKKMLKRQNSMILDQYQMQKMNTSIHFQNSQDNFISPFKKPTVSYSNVNIRNIPISDNGRLSNPNVLNVRMNRSDTGYRQNNIVKINTIRKPNDHMQNRVQARVISTRNLRFSKPQNPQKNIPNSTPGPIHIVRNIQSGPKIAKRFSVQQFRHLLKNQQFINNNDPRKDSSSNIITILANKGQPTNSHNQSFIRMATPKQQKSNVFTEQDEIRTYSPNSEIVPINANSQNFGSKIISNMQRVSRSSGYVINNSANFASSVKLKPTQIDKLSPQSTSQIPISRQPPVQSFNQPLKFETSGATLYNNFVKTPINRPRCNLDKHLTLRRVLNTKTDIKNYKPRPN